VAEKAALTLIKAEDFAEILDNANRIIEAVEDMKIPAISAAFAGISLIRACISATGGDMEWWVHLLREGPDSIVAIPMPAGPNTLGKGPTGKQ
jgi:hypothetical protein